MFIVRPYTGIARIKVGAATETELKDKKLRYEDALNSVKSAIEMGVVPGGGLCMLSMSCDMELKERILAGCSVDEDERLGVEIMFRSLSAPIKQIAKNAGLEGNILPLIIPMFDSLTAVCKCL